MATPANKRQSHSPQPTCLDRIKRQLLDKTDWAAVSASRPVQMTFTPIDQLERFGKRRRLTEADRNRLADSGRRLQPAEFGMARLGSREYTPEVGNMGIRINGVPARRDESIAPSISSQSMLLDREPPCLESDSGIQELLPDNSANPKLQLSTLLQPSGLLSMQSPSPSPAAFNPAAQDDPGRFIDNSPKELSAEIREPSPPSITSYPSQPISPVKRRFTLDDQVLAEQQGMLNIRPTIPDHVSQSERTPMLYMPAQSPTTESIASNQHSPWLPQPKCNIQRFPSRGTDGIAAFLTEFPRPHRRPSPFYAGPDSIATTAEPYTSPVKIFGQSVAPG